MHIILTIWFSLDNNSNNLLHSFQNEYSKFRKEQTELSQNDTFGKD